MKEISLESKNELEKRYRTTAFLIFGQILFSIILVSIVWIIAPSAPSPSSTIDLMPLWIGALFIAVGAFVLRRVLFRWDRLKDIYTLKGISGLYASLQKNAIFLGAMAELIVIIGVVIVFLSGNSYEIFRAGLIALVVFFINFPRKSVWEKIAANLENI